MSPRPAAFLDRDGTIVRDANYLRYPDEVELLPGAAEAIRQLNARDIAVIVVTNQSGIARGYLDQVDYEQVRARLDEMLMSVAGARIDRTYMCPHLPDITGPCNCRKPGLQLYEQAIADFDVDPTRSLFTGDRWRDVEPGRKLGGMTFLLDVESAPEQDLERARREGIATAASLADAVNLFLASRA